MEPPEIYKISEMLDIPLLKVAKNTLLDEGLAYVRDSNNKVVGLNLSFIWKNFTIPNGVFNNLDELEMLILSGNGIKSITKLANLKKNQILIFA